MEAGASEALVLARAKAIDEVVDKQRQIDGAHRRSAHKTLAPSPGPATRSRAPADARAPPASRLCAVAALTLELATARQLNGTLHERNEMLTEYIDNLMYTVAKNDLALAAPTSKGLSIKGLSVPNPLRSFGHLQGQLGLRLQPVLEADSHGPSAAHTHR
jgi:hypothetical protein